jgi:hypothetical protein
MASAVESATSEIFEEPDLRLGMSVYERDRIASQPPRSSYPKAVRDARLAVPQSVAMPRDFFDVTEKIGAGANAAVFGGTYPSRPPGGNASPGPKTDLAVKIFAGEDFILVADAAGRDIDTNFVARMFAEIAMARAAEDLSVGPEVVGTRIVRGRPSTNPSTDTKYETVVGGLTMRRSGQDLMRYTDRLRSRKLREEALARTLAAVSGDLGAFAVLAYLHSRGMFHGDMNLGNVAFARDDHPDDRVVLLDFGFGGVADVTGDALSLLSGEREKEPAERTVSKRRVLSFAFNALAATGGETATATASDLEAAMGAIASRTAWGQGLENPLTLDRETGSVPMARLAVLGLRSARAYAMRGEIITHYVSAETRSDLDTAEATRTLGDATTIFWQFTKALVEAMEAVRATRAKEAARVACAEDCDALLPLAIVKLANSGYTDLQVIPWYVVLDVVTLWVNVVARTRVLGLAEWAGDPLPAADQLTIREEASASAIRAMGGGR